MYTSTSLLVFLFATPILHLGTVQAQDIQPFTIQLPPCVIPCLQQTFINVCGADNDWACACKSTDGSALYNAGCAVAVDECSGQEVVDAQGLIDQICAIENQNGVPSSSSTAAAAPPPPAASSSNSPPTVPNSAAPSPTYNPSPSSMTTSTPSQINSNNNSPAGASGSSTTTTTPSSVGSNNNNAPAKSTASRARFGLASILLEGWVAMKMACLAVIIIFYVQ